jgi:hypothetical protein
MSPNGSSVEYPQVTLGGVTYTLKCTRATLRFRLSKRGADFADLREPNKRFAAMWEIFYAMIGPQAGDNALEYFVQLADNENLTQAVDIAVAQAIPKVFPPTQAPAKAAAEPALN